MKRSISLFIANILSTVYVVLWFIRFDKVSEIANDTIEFLIKILGSEQFVETFVDFFVGFGFLLDLHIILMVIACILGWIAFASKGGKLATAAAVLDTIGGFCFWGIFWANLLILIMRFAGAKNQKEINLENEINTRENIREKRESRERWEDLMNNEK